MSMTTLMIGRLVVLVAAVGIAASLAPRFIQADSPQPQYGASGFDVDGCDKATRPGDDFFRFANGAWIDRTAIPADRSAYSLRAVISDTTEKRLHELMELSATTAGHAPSMLEGKVGAFYKSFMDSARVEQLGARPLATE